jgi:hypothetical protein
MYRYCYSTFANELSKAATRQDRFMMHVASYLLEPITKDENVVDEHGEIYKITSCYAGRWYRGEENVPPNIVKTLDHATMVSKVTGGMNQLITDYIFEDKLPSVCTAVYTMVMAAPLVSPSTKGNLQSSFEQQKWIPFLAEAFVVSLYQDNVINTKKTEKQISSLKDEMALIGFILKRFGKPVLIAVPKDPTESELAYVSALKEAYAEDANVSTISEADLESNQAYKKYKIDFDNERRCYYAAESLREATRDTELFKKPNLSFDGFKTEIKKGTKDAYKSIYKNGYERMLAVTEKAVIVPLTSLLETQLRWINDSVRKGTVHEIVNEENVRCSNGNDGK